MAWLPLCLALPPCAAQFVDSCGRSDVIVDTAPHGARRALVRDVAIGDGTPTFAAALHDAIGWLGALSCLCAVATGWWRACTSGQHRVVGDGDA
eukprot:6872714-Prymnesium_polylepis.1